MRQLKIKSQMLLLFGIILYVCVFPQSIHADGLKFDVEALIPENQYDKQQTYFDLLVKPNQTQALRFKLSNLDKKDLVVDVIPTNATTNQNGEVNYGENTGLIDKTLKYPMTSLLSSKQRIRLAGNESKEVSFDLKIPKDPFEGKIVGGFLFQEVVEETENYSSKGISIDNYFALVKGIQLRENTKPIKPNLKINKVEPTTVSYKRAVTVNIQNTEPDFIHDVTAKVEIKRKGKEEILFSRKQTDVSLAPNSNFDFPVYLENNDLTVGDYVAEVQLSHPDVALTEKKAFFVSEESLANMNSLAVDGPTKKSSDKKENNVFVIGLILFAILLIVFTFYFLKLQRKRSKDSH